MFNNRGFKKQGLYEFDPTFCPKLANVATYALCDVTDLPKKLRIILDKYYYCPRLGTGITPMKPGTFWTY